MAGKFTLVVAGALVAGVVTGTAVHTYVDDDVARQALAGYCQIGTDLFLRMIKMIIAPLVFSTLVVGVAHMGDTKAVGRIGCKAMAWFIGASLVSLLMGMVLVNVLRPGESLNLPLPGALRGCGDALAASRAEGATLIAAGRLVGRGPAARLRRVHFGEAHDREPVADRAQMRHRAVQLDRARATRAGDDVGFPAVAVGQVAAQDALVGEQPGLLHQILGDGQAAFVVQRRARNRGAVEFRFQDMDKHSECRRLSVELRMGALGRCGEFYTPNSPLAIPGPCPSCV